MLQAGLLVGGAGAHEGGHDVMQGQGLLGGLPSPHPQPCPPAGGSPNVLPPRLRAARLSASHPHIASS